MRRRRRGYKVKGDGRIEFSLFSELFNRSLVFYKAAGGRQSYARGGFIGPLMELLGGDIHNRWGEAAAYRDMIEEAREKDGGGTKAPDYRFYAKRVQGFID